MHDLIKLEVLDADGAIRETSQAAAEVGLDRSQFLRRAAGTGAGFVAGGVLFGGLTAPAEAAISRRRKSRRNDVKILNYALTLEYLEAEFYRAALAGGAPNTNPLQAFAQVTSAHEDAHVKALRGVLGRAAIKKPSFDFGDTVTDPAKFAATAQALEDTGVAAYAGQGPNLLQRAVVQAALSIHSVEARHAAWIRFINSGGAKGSTGPAPKAFDAPKSERTVLGIVGDTGFIQS